MRLGQVSRDFGAWWFVAPLLVCAAVAAGCGGSGDGDASPDQLRAMLPPVGPYPVDVEKRYEWEDATSFADEGLTLPKATEPSEVVEVMDRAGFEGAVGELLLPLTGQPRAYSEVARFESPAGARVARDYIQAQALLDQCSGACGMVASPLPLAGMPSARGAQHGPVGGAVADAPNERFLVQYTVGNYLYIGVVIGPAGLVPAPTFLHAVKASYEHAHGQAG